MTHREIILTLFNTFEGNSNFDMEMRLVDEEEDGIYATFHHFGIFLKKQIHNNNDKSIVISALQFINKIVEVNDFEINNAVKSELFSILSLSNEEQLFMEQNLSSKSRDLLNSIWI